MENKKKSLGQLKRSTINITEPIKMDFDLEYRELALFCGKNGIGKTLVLKLTWLFGTFINYYLMSKIMKLPFSDKEVMQFLSDNTFTDNNIDGKISFEYGVADIISLTYDKGKVTDITYLLDDDLEPGAQPVFMSKETRLFSDIIKYIKFKKLLGLNPGIPTLDTDMKKLLEMYRIYNIIFIEQLLGNISTKTTPKLLEDFNLRIKEFDEHFELKDIKVDYTIGDIIYSDKTHTDISIGNLGAGHQALVNMLLSTTYQKY